MPQDKSYKQFLLKKQLEMLRTKKGYHTELITLMIPPDRKISDVTNYLKSEINESSNIKSKLTRKNVIDSITSLLQTLRNIREPPENGLIMFSGAIPQGNTAGTEKNELYIIEPIEPVGYFKYHCSSEFYLEPLENMLREKQTYGIIVIDNKELAIGWVRGSHVEVVRTSTSGVQGKHRAGGQSQRRFERLHEEGIAYFHKRAGELANEVFLPMIEDESLEGIFIGGSGHSKLKFADAPTLDYRVKEKFTEFYDIGVSGAEGIRAVLLKAEDKIENVRYIKEKKLMQQFLYNLSRDTGLAAYGEKEIRECLERSAVETLLLSEGLTKKRIKIKCEQCGYSIEDTVKEEKLPQIEEKLKNQICDECGSSRFAITENYDVINDYAELAEETSADVVMISTETEEGESLISTFGGLAAILRYKMH